MKTTIYFAIILIMAMIAFVSNGQATWEGNDPGAPAGSYLGWDHARDLDFNTNNILRMQLEQTGNVTVNQGAFANGGFLALSAGARL